MGSIGFGSSTKKTNTNQSSQTDPWDKTIPQLDAFLGDIEGLKGLTGPTGDQLDAFETLKRNAAQGNPWTGDLDKLTSDLFGYQSRSGDVTAAYGDLQRRLGDTADGKRLDPSSNPYIAQMMSTVGDDISNRIKQTFAGAGRDVTGNAAGLQAMGRGVSAGTAPILAQFFNDELNRQGDAAKTLYTAGQGSAESADGLDKSALATRGAGADAGAAAMLARDHGANTILNLDQQLKQMPFEDLSLYASLLLPIAGLGGQSQGTSNSTTKGSSSSIGLNLGTIAGAIGSLSDERAKEDIEAVGETNDGQTIYRYRYKGEDEWQLGLIAQEVAKVHPEAVGRRKDGMMTVDYKQATDAAVEENV